MISRLTRFSWLLFFLLIPLLFVWPFLWGKTLFFGDNYSLMVPGKLFIKEALSQGVLPYWNPYSLSGTPFLADINQSFFYPTTLLFLWIHPAIALNIAIVWHWVFSLLGMYFFARRFGSGFWGAITASIMWGTSQIFVATANNLAAIQTTSYLPWILGLFLAMMQKKRWAYWVFPGCVGLALLGGHPQPLAYAALGCIPIMLAYKQCMKKELGRIIGLSFIVFLLTLVVILPLLELAPLTTRSRLSVDDIFQGSLTPLHLLQLVIPNLFSDPHIGLVWGPDWNRTHANNLYVPLALWLGGFCLWRKRNSLRPIDRIFGLAAILAVLFTQGEVIPGLRTTVEYLPFMRVFRDFAGIGILWPLLASPVFGRGISSLLTETIPKKAVICIFLFWLFATTLLFSGLTHFEQLWLELNRLTHNALRSSAFHTLARDYLIFWNFFRQFTVTFGFFAASMLGLMLPKKTQPITLTFFVTVSMWWAAKPLFTFAPQNIYNYTQSVPAAWVKTHLPSTLRILPLSGYTAYTGLAAYHQDMVQQAPFQPSRFTLSERSSLKELRHRQAILSPNWHLPHLVPSIFGFSTFVLHETADYWGTPEAGTSINDIQRVPLTDKRISEQGVNYFIVDTLLSRESMKEWLPDFPVVYEENDMAILNNPHAQPITQVVDLNSNRFTPTCQVFINALECEIQAQEQAELTLRMPAYPGWTCHLGTQPCHLAKKGNLTQSLAIPQGSHSLELRFQPWYYPYIIYISLSAWFAYAVLFIRKLRVLT